MVVLTVVVGRQHNHDRHWLDPLARIFTNSIPACPSEATALEPVYRNASKGMESVAHLPHNDVGWFDLFGEKGERPVERSPFLVGPLGLEPRTG